MASGGRHGWCSKCGWWWLVWLMWLVVAGVAGVANVAGGGWCG